MSVAIVALAQPWAFAIYRRMFQPGSIDVYETGNIEVGFGSAGASIALQGTLRALHRDQFVRRARLEVIRRKDGSTRHYDWMWFRGANTAGPGYQFELSSGFMLTTGQPQRYNIQFLDPASGSDLRLPLQVLRTEWNSALTEAIDPETVDQFVAEKRFSELEPLVSGVHDDFCRSPAYTVAYTMVDRLCYWEPGEYTLKLFIVSARPNRSFEKVWGFVLAESEVTALHLNSVKILGETCSRPIGYYNFAFPQYAGIGAT